MLVQGGQRQVATVIAKAMSRTLSCAGRIGFSEFLVGFHRIQPDARDSSSILGDAR